MNLPFRSTLTLTFNINNRLCPVHDIQAYFGKISLTDVSKILNLGELFKVKVKVKVRVIVGAAFHKLKYKLSLKSL